MRVVGLAAALAVVCLVSSAGAGVPVPPPPGDGYPTWSPDGSVIAFLSERDGTALRVVKPDGTGEQRFPWLPANGTYSFSPDWSRIAAYVDGQLVVERLDGSDRLSLGRAAYATRAVWSRDGTRVAFVTPSATPNQADVVVARIDGSEAHRVATGSQPAWSPVNDRIAYVAGSYDTNELHVVDADGGADVTLGVGGGYGQLAWSPQGGRLAFVHRLPGESYSSLEILDMSSTSVTRFAKVVPYDFAWSPDGASIAYSNGAGVWVLDLASGRTTQVARFGWQPAWSPDGTGLAFAAGGECRNRNGIYRTGFGPPGVVRLTNDCRILGTPGDDVLTGTPLADVLVGEGGNDTLKAVWGDFIGDTLEGGPGKDLLLGSFRSDILDGGAGADILRGGPSADRLVGGAGRDVLRGEGGRDAIYARDGRRDVVDCGANTGQTAGPEGDVAYVDARDRVAKSCEYVYRPGPAPPVRGAIRLLIRVWPQGNLGPKSAHRDYTLRCRPARGTLPGARAACARLVRVQNPFAPPSPAEDCAWVGTSTATAGVKGFYGGRHVARGFERRTTCGIQHWNRVSFLFPVPRTESHTERVDRSFQTAAREARAS